jgi:hypothetical protein
MKRMLQGMKKRFFFLLIVIITLISSCRTVRELPAERLRPVDAERLVKQIEENAFDYSGLTIRRINVQFSDGNVKTSFRASLKAEKDKKILASISKINIPVGRVLLAPESVTYVNYIDRNYFVDDYSYLSSLLNFGLSFETIQSVVTNPSGGGIVSENSGKALKNFYSTVENGRYVLQSENVEKSTSSLQNAGFGRKRNQIPVIPKKNQENSIQKKLYFNPGNFNLEKLIFHDPLNEWMLEVDYSDFVKVDKKDYPGAIDMKMISPGEEIELKIKLNGFSVEQIDSLDLNIPAGYEQIHVN